MSLLLADAPVAAIGTHFQQLPQRRIRNEMMWQIYIRLHLLSEFFLLEHVENDVLERTGTLQ